MSQKWKRSTDVPFPAVWHRFTVQHPQTGDVVHYRVQDLPEERYKEALDIMISDFLRDEPMCRSRKCTEDPAAIADFRKIWAKVQQDKICLVCFREGSDEIMGMNFLKITQKDAIDPPTNYCKSTSDVLNTMDYIAQQGNLFEHYGVDKFINGYGLIVPPKNRGLKLGVEILKARVPLAKALGIQLTSTIFSNRASQSAATRAGFEDSYEISWDDLGKIEPWMYFPVSGTPTVKLQSLQIK
uniref:N-acetyltransferase domain-containing protein n=1 Tax=Nyssomyia neivai TaxID=330878 RepID=A0A1L8DAT3_9DIPT